MQNELKSRLYIYLASSNNCIQKDYIILHVSKKVNENISDARQHNMIITKFTIPLKHMS